MPRARKNYFINREISWLSFNYRVLQEAKDPRVPLVERLRFLGIFSNNQDEFFRVRVATVKRMAEVGKKGVLIGGKTPDQVLNEIHHTVMRQKEEFSQIYKNVLLQLEDENIFMANESNLDEAQREFVREYYLDKVAPLLVPIMLKSVPRFPELRDKSIYLAVKLWSKTKELRKQYALIEIPSDQTPRFIVLPNRGEKKYIIFLDDIIRFNLDRIFGIFEYEHMEAYMFKITRDGELDLDDDVSKGFYEKIKHSVKQRKKGQPVRFVHDANMPADVLRYLIGNLELDDDDNIIPGSRYHNSKDLMKFPNVGGAHLEYRRFAPVPHPLLQGRSLLDAVGRNDVMLHYPYHSFDTFVHFLRESAIDPNVTSIKVTLYRMAEQSQVVNALINAVQNGKSVTAMIELRARFDEENNLYWSRRLQDEGVKVVFGVPEMKVHCKLCLITRKRKGDTQQYAVLSTGNFHEKTARIYSDVALFTANKALCTEVDKVFSVIEKPYRGYRFQHLILSPYSMRNKYLKLINREIRHAKEKKEASIYIKLNSLVDEPLIRKLYQASQAGVKVRLVVRGICSLIPGVKGLSENIRVRSIVDRYLEHARIFVFHNNGKPEFFISSADWMTRNLDYRFEVTVPIYDAAVQQQLSDYLELQWKDNQKARILDKGLTNKYVVHEPGMEAVRSQIAHYELFRNMPALESVKTEESPEPQMG